MTVFFYNYKTKPSDIRDFPVILKNGKTTKAQAAFKERRRDEKVVNSEIAKMEKEMATLDTKGQKGYERYQELTEKIRLLRVEIDFNSNLDFVGEGAANYGEGAISD